MKKLIYAIIVLLLFGIFFQSIIYADPPVNYNEIRHAYTKYYKNRDFSPEISNDFSLNFINELSEKELINNNYYYQVKYNSYSEIVGFACIYDNNIIFSYILPDLKNLNMEEKNNTINIKSISYIDSEGKPFLIKKYKNNLITSVTRYDFYGRRKISEIYKKGIISTLSYTNEASQPVFIQTFESSLYAVLTEICIISKENENNYFKILINEKTGLKYITEYLNNKRTKVMEYHDNKLHKIYYYNEEGVLYKFEIYDLEGNIVFVYNN